MESRRVVVLKNRVFPIVGCGGPEVSGVNWLGCEKKFYGMRKTVIEVIFICVLL